MSTYTRKALRVAPKSCNFNRYAKVSIHLALILFFFLSSNVGAVTFKSGDEIVLESSDELADDLIATGKTVTIDGTIHGEALTLSERLRMRGVVHGAMISGAVSLNIDGTIEGSLVGAGRNIYIEGIVEGSSYLIGQSIEISPSAILSRDLQACAGELLLEGRIIGDLRGFFGTIIIDGAIDGDLDITCDNLEIRESAEILGNVTYSSSTEAVIEDGAVIVGSIEREEPDELITESDFSGLFWVGRMYSFLASLVIGILAIFVLGELFRNTTKSIRKNGAKSAGFGILFYSVGLVTAFFLVFTVVGIPAAALISLIMAVVFLTAKIFVATALGSILLRKDDTGGNGILAAQMALGSAILIILFTIPYLGWVLYFVTAILGSGALTLSFLNRD
ncbi:MAG: polymer-forming cytoskeletal protein [candidate division Zixibacteria bacterium]|nr:polymer-forming cytoskeletal protein [candidate division Zixibacteria bacterium]